MNSIVIVLAIVASLYLIERYTNARKRLPYPPGPGQIETVRKWLTLGVHNVGPPRWKNLADLRKAYGDYCHLDLLGNHVLVINSYDAAVELLDKRGQIHSGRAVQTMLGELGTWKGSVGLSAYGNPWREKRKLIHRTVSKADSDEFGDMVANSARKGLKKILKTPDDFNSHVRFAIGLSVLRIVYGIEVEDGDDALLLANEKSIACLGRAPFAKYMVDLIPAMRHIPRWVPGTAWKDVGEEFKELRRQMLAPPFERVKEHIAAGKPLEYSMASSLLAMNDINEEQIKLACGSFFNAGIATTLGGVRSFLLCMILNPDKQAKIHAELDEVLGDGNGRITRLPETTDRANLPYTMASIKEAMRWHVVTPTGLQHSSLEDDFFQGYFIPKDTVIVPNEWAMSRDETYYPEPEKFSPERHLGENPQLDPYEWLFGFGRRTCAGQRFAKVDLFMMATHILSCFKITPPKDANGKFIPQDPKPFHAGMAVPFECKIELRSPAAAELINAL